MSLDLHKTAAQIQGMAGRLKERQGDQRARLEKALRHLHSAGATQLEQRRREGKYTWLVAGLDGALAGRHHPPALPDDYVVLAVDGSHIDVDRHSPARCYLINIGRVLLQYGSRPNARLESEPRLYAEDAELLLEDAQSVRDQPLDGALLGIKRSVEEVDALADLATQAPPELPVVALLDGSLILWGLTGQAYPEFVRQALLEEGLLPALDALRGLARERTLALSAYVSLPRSTDVVNALRLVECPYPTVNCDQYCRGLPTGQRPCDAVATGLTDRDLFSQVLEPGQRSDVFRSTSSIVDRYGEHTTNFFYLSVGQELARVEVPAWVATDEKLLGLAHAALLAQCHKGHGYPVALSEAHEQAVVTGPDREHFRLLMEQALEERRLPAFISEKARSKRTRWV